MNDLPLRAFVARPRGTEIDPIETVLRGVGVTADDPSMRVSAAVAPLYDTILSAIRSCDFAVFIYDGKDSRLTYELGACDALGKPVLLIALSSHPLPSYLQRYIHIRWDSAVTTAIEEAIVHFVEEVRKGIKPRRVLKRGPAKKPQDPAIHDVISQVRSLRKEHSGTGLEHLVRKLLEEKGGFVEIHAAPGDPGVDLALWSDAVKSVMPQPIFVEVKGGRLSPSTIAQAEKRLRDAVSRGGAVAGLLLYLDALGQRFNQGERSASNIWRADIEDFAEELSTRSLSAVLRHLGGQPSDG